MQGYTSKIISCAAGGKCGLSNGLKLYINDRMLF